MKNSIISLPILCPACNEIMVTDYPGKWITTKRCSKFVNHQITIAAASDSLEEEQVYRITILLSHAPKIEVTWHVLSEEVIIKKDDNSKAFKLPYFYPDLSDFNKLIDKIKTYMVFS